MVKPLKGLAQHTHLSPGQRAARRGTSLSRPWHDDYAQEQAAAAVASLLANGWVQQVLGQQVDARVGVARDGGSITFVLTRLHSTGGVSGS